MYSTNVHGVLWRDISAEIQQLLMLCGCVALCVAHAMRITCCASFTCSQHICVLYIKCCGCHSWFMDVLYMCVCQCVCVFACAYVCMYVCACTPTYHRELSGFPLCH